MILLRASVLLSLFCLCSFVSPLAAEDSKADQQYQFACYLRSEADFFRAITELKRFRFQYPQDIRARNVDFLIADCYYRARRWKDALQSFEVITSASEFRKKTLAQLRSSRCLIELEATDKAIARLSPIANQADTSDTNTVSYSLMMTALAIIRTKDISRTQDILNRLCQSTNNATTVTFGQAAMKSLNDSEGAPMKSPVKAALLSTVIPGAGHIYAGKRADGLVAAASILLFSALAYDANQSGHYGERNFLVFFNAGQYLGNIYGAQRAVKRDNQKRVERLFTALNDNIVSTIDNMQISSELPCD